MAGGESKDGTGGAPGAAVVSGGQSSALDSKFIHNGFASAAAMREAEARNEIRRHEAEVAHIMRMSHGDRIKALELREKHRGAEAAARIRDSILKIDPNALKPPAGRKMGPLERMARDEAGQPGLF